MFALGTGVCAFNPRITDESVHSSIGLGTVATVARALNDWISTHSILELGAGVCIQWSDYDSGCNS